MSIIFETPRLTMRNWIPAADAEQAFEIYGDPDVMRFLSSKVEESVETQRAGLQRVIDRYAKLNNGTGSWAIIEKETGQIVGAILKTATTRQLRQPYTRL